MPENRRLILNADLRQKYTIVTAHMFNSSDKTTPGAYGPSQTALLLIDFHTRFVEKVGGPNAPAALQVATELRSWAKAQGIQVIQCLLDAKTAPYPTLKGVQRYAGVMEMMSAPGGGGELHEKLQGGDHDDTVFRRRPGHASAFYSPGLDEFLKNKCITSLIIAGLPTSGSVGRTAFAAADAEYVTTVISDACVDPQQDMHEAMVDTLLGAKGWVSTFAAFKDGFANIYH